mmetsp:Transcript_16315/g.48690  ORF Transcript_16315/g.48690 Transcript_16315/m.48690 type:complete len:170 (+) Transcript_16315:273-782(+)
MSAHRAREVSQSFLALMFSEMVHYQTSKICNAVELELALEGIGRTIGKKVLELLCYRDCLIKRDHGVISMLQFISTTSWKVLFGKAADSLERSTENENEYMIVDAQPITNCFVSVPNHLGQLNCAAYMAGIVMGIMDSAQFAARVSAHSMPDLGSLLAHTSFIHNNHSL